jgi:hypothetical protein
MPQPILGAASGRPFRVPRDIPSSRTLAPDRATRLGRQRTRGLTTAVATVVKPNVFFSSFARRVRTVRRFAVRPRRRTPSALPSMRVPTRASVLIASTRLGSAGRTRNPHPDRKAFRLRDGAGGERQTLTPITHRGVGRVFVESRRWTHGLRHEVAFTCFALEQGF